MRLGNVKNKISLAILLAMIWVNATAQSAPNPIKDYREILESRFANRNNWYLNNEMYLNKLLQLTMNKHNKSNLIVPLEFILAPGDTVVRFAYSKDLRKIKDSKKIQFRNLGPPGKIGFKTLEKTNLMRLKVNFDSVYQIMSSNLLVNSVTFNIDQYLDSNQTDYCCRAPRYDETLNLIYVFFINGILLSEDSVSGSLHYVSY